MLLGRAAPEICVCSRERKLGAYGAYMDPSSLQEPPLMTALKETRAYIGPLRGKMGDPSRGADGICASSPNQVNGLERPCPRQVLKKLGIPVQELAVQRRYNINLFLSVLTGSLQGVAERPLPCNYNAIQQDIALSRRRRGFKSRRGRQINNLQEKCLLSV